MAKKGRTFLSAIPVVGKALAESGALYFSAVRNQIVCIDDLERRGAGLNIKDVLGLASFLKEQRHCKIILLLNDKQLGQHEAEFKDNFEKVVDSELKFTPTPTESVGIALTEVDDISSKIRENCEILKISNIRVVKRIERLARMVAPCIAVYGDGVLQQAVHTLTLIAWSKYQPTLAPSMDFIRRTRARNFYALERDKEGSEEELVWDQLLDRYKFVTLDELDEALVEGIENGFFDCDRIAPLAAAAQSALQEVQERGPHHRAWSIYRDSFDNDEDELVQSMVDAVQSSSRFISPMNLESSVRLLKDLGRTAEATKILETYVTMREGDAKFWDLSRHAFS
jgi:hypothetical protein